MAQGKTVRNVVRTKGGRDKTPARYRPGAVWVRKKDGETFVLDKKDVEGLRFEKKSGAFSEDMFRPR